jgi:hypothetical protein
LRLADSRASSAAPVPGDRFQEGVGGKAAVQQDDHARAQRAGQPLPVAGLATAARAEDGVDDRPGAARDERDQQDLRVTGGGSVLVGALAQPGPGGRVVGDVQVRAVDRDHQQAGPASPSGADRGRRAGQQVK